VYGPTWLIFNLIILKGCTLETQCQETHRSLVVQFWTAKHLGPLKERNASMATRHSRSPKCGQLNNTRHSLFPSYTLGTGTFYGFWTSNIKSLHAELFNGILGFWIFRIRRFLRVVFNEKPVFTVCLKRPLTGKRAENIAHFFTLLVLRFLVLHYAWNMKKKSYREQQSCLKDNTWKKKYGRSECTRQLV